MTNSSVYYNGAQMNGKLDKIVKLLDDFVKLLLCFILFSSVKSTDIYSPMKTDIVYHCCLCSKLSSVKRRRTVTGVI